jgi:hypothetical protein
MMPSTLPRSPKLQKPSIVSVVRSTRHRTLRELYLRRATLENLIQSLEVYDRTLKMVDQKLVPLS